MIRIAVFVAASLAASLLATSSAATPPDGAAPAPAKRRAVHGKPSAPVTIAAKLDAAAGTGQVTVRFDAAGTDVELAVRGLDGLVVQTPAEPTPSTSVSRGEARTLDVAFTPGEGRSQLVVSVSGRFPGGRRATVATFAIGEPSARQKAERGAVVTDRKGNRLRIAPTEPAAPPPSSPPPSR